MPGTLTGVYEGSGVVSAVIAGMALTWTILKDAAAWTSRRAGRVRLGRVEDRLDELETTLETVRTTLDAMKPQVDEAVEDLGKQLTESLRRQQELTHLLADGRKREKRIVAELKAREIELYSAADAASESSEIREEMMQRTAYPIDHPEAMNAKTPAMKIEFDTELKDTGRHCDQKHLELKDASSTTTGQSARLRGTSDHQKSTKPRWKGP
ncbi:hypothetical protein B0A49_09469 [Cryomyces minteri]|uniref:Uncharacterized protein n=1 Tax=Cryomyces minteri TaxID=331657 RepID=A0A4U0WR97_9PEZI|nr:hypothetical protein B0A49_09469 [Cryomyces minteri]